MRLQKNKSSDVIGDDVDMTRGFFRKVFRWKASRGRKAQKKALFEHTTKRHRRAVGGEDQRRVRRLIA